MRRSPSSGCKRPEAWQRCTLQSTDRDVPAHHVSHQYEEQKRESACCQKFAIEASSNNEAVPGCEACRCLSWHLPLTTWRQSKSSWKWVTTRQAKVHLSACFGATDLRNHLALPGRSGPPRPCLASLCRHFAGQVFRVPCCQAARPSCWPQRMAEPTA